MMGDSPLGPWGIAIPATLFILIALIEWLRPRRSAAIARSNRWITNFGVFLSNAITGQLLAFLVIVPVAAAWAAKHEFGLFNLTAWPWWVEALAAFILLDFAVWAQHVVMHKFPLLWRMHKVHHSDRHLDLTSALRFHPTEIIVSTLYKSAWVVLLGVPVLIALAFELWLNMNALFNHSNIRLPKKLDKVLRLFIVTPDMHLVHHSTIRSEHDRNFGFALTIWDRLSGFYLPVAKGGAEGQGVGIKEAQDEKPGQLLWTLMLPFRK